MCAVGESEYVCLFIYLSVYLSIYLSIVMTVTGASKVTRLPAPPHLALARPTWPGSGPNSPTCVIL